MRGSEQTEVTPPDREYEGPDATETLSGVTLTDDALGDYLRAIRKTPLLSAEQEVELSKDIEAGLFAKQTLETLAADRAALDAMVEHYDLPPEDLVADLKTLMEIGRVAFEQMQTANLRLVIGYARRHVGRGVSFIDLIQEGNIGLIRAVQKFDYTKGYKFSTYATNWINQAIRRGVYNQGRTVRLPTHVGEKVDAIHRARKTLLPVLKREPTADELAKALDMSVSTIEELLDYSREAVRLDTPVESGGSTTIGDMLVEDGPEVFDMIYLLEQRRAIDKALKSLNEEHAEEILRRRYGLGGDKPQSYKLISFELGLSQASIKTIERNALMMLRAGSPRRHPSTTRLVSR